MFLAYRDVWSGQLSRAGCVSLLLLSAGWIPRGAKTKTSQALGDILEFTIYPANENHALELRSFCLSS